MGDKREFLQRYPPYVLLPLDAGSDIHYGRNHKSTGSLLSSIITREITVKNLKKYEWYYCFLFPVDHISTIIQEITSPAIEVTGDREIAEGEVATGCVRLGEGVGVTDTLSDGVEFWEVVVAGRGVSPCGTTVIVVLRTSFIEGLLTLTK